SRLLARLWMLAALFFVAGKIALQATLHNGSLGNAVMLPLHPSAHDSFEYMLSTGSIYRVEGFVAVFGEGLRIPCFCLLLSPFFALSASPLRLARLAQIALTALIPLLFFLTLLWAMRTGSTPRSRPIAWIGAAVVALWIPLYHYSSALLAEA